MLKKNWGGLVSLSIMLALLVAAVMPFAVFAQDETPPPVDAPIVEEVPSAEPPVQEEQPAGEETPAEEQPVEELTIPEALEQLPEGTDLVVVDEEGEVLPLATEEAAQALSNGDPYFTDGASIVGFSTTGTCPPAVTICNTSATPLSDAINAFAASGTASGAITVEAGGYAAGVAIDGANGNLSNLAGLIGAGSSLTTLTGNVSVTNMFNTFTFQGFTLNGAFIATNNSGDLNITDVVQRGSVSKGISVSDHTGNINLTNVTAIDNVGSGAQLDNTSGTGNITLTGANVFNTNDFAGLYVNSNGDISASNVTASGNDVMGAFLQTPDTVMLTGANVFNGNAYGVYLLGPGSVTINNATISNNSSFGIVNLVGVGNILTLNCVTFSGNVSDVTGGGSMVDNECVPVVPPIVPAVVHPVSNDDGNNPFAPAVIIVPAPVPFEASALPGSLPSGNVFAAGLNLTLHLNTELGEFVQKAPGGVTVSFEIPESLQGKTFNVLFWEDGKWVSIPVKVVGSVAYFTAYGPGTYVLVATP